MVSQKSHDSDQETFGYDSPKDLESCQRYVHELDGLSKWSSATPSSSETFSDDSSPYIFDVSESEKEFESMDSSPCFDDSESEKEFESMDSSPRFDDSESEKEFVGLTSKHEFTDLTECVASNFEAPYLPLSYQIMEDDDGFESDPEESFSLQSSNKVPNATEKPVPKPEVTICNPYKLRRKRAIRSTPNIDRIKRIKKNQ